MTYEDVYNGAIAVQLFGYHAVRFLLETPVLDFGTGTREILTSRTHGRTVQSTPREMLAFCDSVFNRKFCP